MQRFPLFKIYSRPSAEQKKGHLLHLGSKSAVVTTESDAMPGQIPDPSVTAGSLPSLGPLAGISATTLTDKLKFGDLQEFGTMLSPLHFLDSLGKRPLVIKTEVEDTSTHHLPFKLIRMVHFEFSFYLADIIRGHFCTPEYLHKQHSHSISN
uniref:Uncharacterized protein n=1 Tax=Stegastes partitus TaxID=144197 RepID=A0A3B5A2S3_9TELE